MPVITGYASGDQGAAHHAGEMLIGEYPPEESAPVQSSNYRELDTVLRPLEEWGHRLVTTADTYTYRYIHLHLSFKLTKPEVKTNIIL